MIRRSILTLALIVGLSAQTLLQRMAAPVKFQWGLETGYQSNPLNLSRVEQNELAFDPTPLGTAKTIDSGVLTSLLKIYYRPLLFDNHPTRFYLFSFYHRFTSIAQKNYFSLNLTLEQPLGNWRFLKIGYGYVPKYYLRNYLDEDLGDKLRYSCTYATTKFWAGFEHRLGRKVTLEWRGQTRARYYTSRFTEYDVQILEGSLDARYEPSAYWRFKLHVLYGWARDVNRQDEENRSYRSLEFTPGLVYTLRSGFIKRLSAELAVRQRAYLSEVATDPLHNGRGQIDREVRAALYPRTSGRWDWYVYGGYRRRGVISRFQRTIDLKTFQRWELGLRITLDTLWDIYL